MQMLVKPQGRVRDWRTIVTGLDNTTMQVGSMITIGALSLRECCAHMHDLSSIASSCDVRFLLTCVYLALP